MTFLVKTLKIFIIVICIFSFSFADTGKGVSEVGELTSFTYGTTVIVHGLNPDANYDLYQAQNWTMTMAYALANRVGRAQIFTISEGSVEQIANIRSAGEKIIIWDWLKTSQFPWFGFAEGEGDALAAILIREAQKSDPYWNLKKLHFIGHSRGAVVSSEAIQRLGINAYHANIEIDQKIHFTTLDAHPWDNSISNDDIIDPFTAEDHDVNSDNIGVVGWDNVGFADNYWHFTDNDNYEGYKDLDGLENIPGFSSKSLSTNDKSYIDMSHGGVHAWYHGTIDTNATNDGAFEPESIFSDSWYPNNERQALGFNYNLELIANQNPTSVFDDWTIDPWSVFNGDFQKLPAISKIVIEWPDILTFPVVPSKIPGWCFQGGSGTGHIELFPNYIYIPNPVPISYNPHLVLDRNNDFLKHNYIFIPNAASKIYFRYAVSNKSNNGNQLQVLLDNTIIGQYNLPVRQGFVYTSAYIPYGIRGTTKTLTFKILPGGGSVDSEVKIDDIGFGIDLNISTSIAVSVPSENTENLYKAKSESPTAFAQLHVYDNLNRHTGALTDTTWETGIPGSHYYTYTDSTGMSYIQITVPNSNYDYKYEVKSLSDNIQSSFVIDDNTGESTKSIAFSEINLNTNGTVLTTYSDTTSLVSLEIDSDGDGSIDCTQTPSTVTQNYVILATTEGKGTITPSDSVFILNGEDLAFQIYPDPEYKILDVIVDGKSTGSIEEYTFSNIDSSHTIHAKFVVATAIDGKTDLPARFCLMQNYPNPFNPSTDISFSIVKATFVQLYVYNALGQKVSTLVNRKMNSGVHQVKFHSEGLSSGVYYYRLVAGEFVSVKKMLVIR